MMFVISLWLGIPGLVAAQPKPITTPPGEPVVPPKPTCADPAAHSIGFSVVSKTSPTTGRVRITGVVKNVGPDPYVSHIFKPTAFLSETNSFRPKAERTFEKLAHGEEITLVYERDWPPKPPTPLPPTYYLWIDFPPPKTTLGGAEPDCNRSNNHKERNGAEINGLFLGPVAPPPTPRYRP